jgi:hypothetical protein
MASFDTRAQVARKSYQCWTCRGTIPAGEYYAYSAGINDDGEFVTTRMCIECAFVATQKDGVAPESLQEGCFTEQKIPNCLRKVRSDYRVNPKKAAEKYKIFEIKSPPPEPKKQIVVKASEFERKVFHFPEGKFKLEHFPKGGTITIKAGVNGKSRQAIIKGAWSTDGTAFENPKRQIAILTEKGKGK